MTILDIDTDLLSNELQVTFDNVVGVTLSSNIKMDEEKLLDSLQHGINSLFQYTTQNYYHIDSCDSLFSYLFKTYENNFKDFTTSDNDLILLCTISTSLFLSKSSAQSLLLVYLLLNNLDGLEHHIDGVTPYLEAHDLRGLLFWAVKILSSINYDRSSDFNITYEYAPPKVTLDWLKKHRKPEQPMEFWFYNSIIGRSLFLVLYTPKCRYAKCSGCNLPSLSSQDKTTSPSKVYKQVDYVLHESISSGEKNTIKEVIVSNNGNLFDIKTMPTLSLLYSINTLIEELPNLKKIVIESRIEYLNEHQLKTIEEVVSAHEERNIQIEIALGFEIFDDEIRNGYYKKGFNKSDLEKLMPLFSKYNISLKFYMMYKAVPNMSTKNAIADINNASVYAHELFNEYSVGINIHISPTYVAVGTLLEKEFNEGNYEPPGPKEVNKLCNELILYNNVSYYISLNDEGLSYTHIEDDYREFIKLKKKIDYFNSYQKWKDS
ncbi:hypothetical protein [Sulfurimonas sp.]